MRKLNENLLYELIHDFLTDYLPEKRNCSIHTVKAYRITLNQLLDFVKEQKNFHLMDIDFDCLNETMIANFLEYLENHCNCSVQTRNYKLACLRSFFNYATMRDPSLGKYQASILNVPLKKLEKIETIDFLSEEAIAVLLKQPDVSSGGKEIRNLFCMVLMYDTAARIQEILNLRPCDFRLGGTPQVKLLGKGNKFRSVPLMEKTVDHFNRYIDYFHSGDIHSQAPLFYAVYKDKGRPISGDTIRVFLNKYAKMAHQECPEIPEKIHPHLLRHSRAMHLYQEGMDLMLISQWLGHADISTTLIYAHADTEMKRAAIQKANAVCFPEVTEKDSPYDVNDDEVLKHLYGLK